MKEEQIKKINEIKRILPIVWNSYEHMRDVRMRESNNFRNFLLIIISFLPIISLTLFTYFRNELFFIPIAFQILSFILLIKTYFVHGPQVPWINPDHIFGELDDGMFETRFFITLKALENDTFMQLREVGKWITYSVYSLLLSVYLLVLGGFFMYLDGILLYYLAGLLTILVIFIYRFYIKQVKYSYDVNCKKYSNKMGEWLNETKTD
jgi:hypothetical protein